MTRMLKIFTVMFCCVHFAFGAFAASGLPSIIRVKDSSGKKKLPDIIVTTTNIKNGLKAKTDSEGMVSFAEKCIPFKNTYEKNKQIGGVKVCAEDPRGIREKTCKYIKDSCDYTIYMPYAKSKPGYPSARQMEMYAFDKNGSVLSYPVCDTTYTKYPTTVTKHCEKDFFKNTKVQKIQAESLVKLYAQSKYGKQILCATKYRSVNNDDYLACTSTDGKYVFEFRFDSLSPSSNTGKLQENITDALCRIAGGKFVRSANDNFECFKDTKQKTKDMCTQLYGPALEFGMETAFADYFYMQPGHTESERVEVNNPPCRFVLDNRGTGNKRHKYQGIDSNIFAKIQIQFGKDAIALISRYVQAKIPDFKSLECDKAPKIFEKGLNDYDDIISCRLETADTLMHTIDFVFDDIIEGDSTNVAGGMSGMKCIASNGVFDGKNCIGIGPSQCKALGYKHKTEFDKERNICIMYDAVIADEVRKNQNVAKIAGATVVGVVLTVATEGAGAAGAVALIATAVGGVASGVSEMLGEIQNDKVRDFVAGIIQCPYSEKCTDDKCTLLSCDNSSCAKSLLLDNFKDIISAQKKDDQVANAALYGHDLAWEKISQYCVDEEAFKAQLNDTVSTLNVIIKISDWTKIVSDLLTLKLPSKTVGTLITKIAPKAAETSVSLGITSKRALAAVKAFSLVNSAQSAGADVHTVIKKIQ